MTQAEYIEPEIQKKDVEELGNTHLKSGFLGMGEKENFPELKQVFFPFILIPVGYIKDDVMKRTVASFLCCLDSDLIPAHWLIKKIKGKERKSKAPTKSIKPKISPEDFKYFIKLKRDIALSEAIDLEEIGKEKFKNLKILSDAYGFSKYKIEDKEKQLPFTGQLGLSRILKMMKENKSTMEKASMSIDTKSQGKAAGSLWKPGDFGAAIIAGGFIEDEMKRDVKKQKAMALFLQKVWLEQARKRQAEMEKKAKDTMMKVQHNILNIPEIDCLDLMLDLSDVMFGPAKVVYYPVWILSFSKKDETRYEFIDGSSKEKINEMEDLLMKNKEFQELVV